jgi:very-short-patch-repair endonuclease
MRGPDTKSTARARSRRQRGTRAEWVLWLELRDRRLGGFKFARQQPIGPYYVDFICRDKRLIVEVDGGQHSDNLADRDREIHLIALGYSIVRVWNNDVLGNIAGVLQMLASELEIAPHPAPLPAGGERVGVRGGAAPCFRNEILVADSDCLDRGGAPRSGPMN